MVVQAVTASIDQPRGTIPSQQISAALQTLQAWMNILPADNLIPFITILIRQLDPEDEETFLPASETLQEIMSKSTLSDGAGTKSLTEPLLLWLDAIGTGIVSATVQSNNVSEVSHSLCKLLVALGDHSALYLAANIASAVPVTAEKTKGLLVQTFLRLIMSYTGLPGYYGVDEEESELTLSFWYLFQEALWSADFDEQEDTGTPAPRSDPVQIQMAKAVYIELVQILRRKVAFPSPPSGWSKGLTSFGGIQIPADSSFRSDRKVQCLSSRCGRHSHQRVCSAFITLYRILNHHPDTMFSGMIC